MLDFRDSGGVGDVDPDVADGDGATDGEGETLERRVAALEEENAGLRELVEGQGSQLEELARQVAALEGTEQQVGNTKAFDAGDDQEREWRPPRRRPGMPDAGLVTLEEQPDEEYAFGPAAALVAEWREVRTGAQGGASGSRVDRVVAAVRRWELEAKMLRDFCLTLPPETHPLDDARREDHVRWRQQVLTEARRELAKAQRLRSIRRVLTLGLWRG